MPVAKNLTHLGDFPDKVRRSIVDRTCRRSTPVPPSTYDDAHKLHRRDPQSLQGFFHGSPEGLRHAS